MPSNEEASQYATDVERASRQPLRVLFVTSQWPDQNHPQRAPFVVSQVDFLRKAGVDVEVFFYRGEWRLWRYVKAAWALRKKMRHNSYDLVHARFAQAGLIAAVQRTLPFVVTYGGTDVLGRRNAQGRLLLRGVIQRFVARRVARLAAANIVVAPHLARALGVAGAYVVSSGIDLDLFRPMDRDEARRRLDLPREQKVVLFVGDPKDPRDKKRYRLARSVIDRATEQCPDVKLVTVYSRPHTDMPLFMNAADVLLFTSRSEGSPNVVKEALACNLPVVSVDVGDVYTRLSGIEGCVVSDTDAPDRLAQRLLQVLDRATRIEGRRAVEHLGGLSMAEATINVYKQVLSARRKRYVSKVG